MKLLTITQFRANISKYLEMSNSEHIAIKGAGGIFDITPNKSAYQNPSPSGDPFWDVPENVCELNKRIKEMDNRDTKDFLTLEQLKHKLKDII